MKRCLAATLFVLLAVSPMTAPAAEADLPAPVQQYEGISYYSGGVGIEERRSIPQLYPLKLVFATDRGHLLCNADVTVSTGGKVVFRGAADHGPWLFVDLPPGTYDLEAVQDGKTRTIAGVSVRAGKRRTVLLRWKTTEVDMGL